MREQDRENGQTVKERLTARYGSQCACRKDLIVLRGQHGVTVYGCHHILLYTPREIRLCLGERTVSVCGSGLYCTSFSAGAVNVRGEVWSVCYQGREACNVRGEGKATQ